MDFAASKLNVISSDHCDGKVIYWPAQAAAAVPITVDNYHITVPVTVDGHNMTAIIDTGASTSSMRLDIATVAFGLTPKSPDMKPEGHLGSDEKAVIYRHAFKSLTFDGITVNNPRIVILTDVVNKNADHRMQTGSNTKRESDSVVLPQVIVGMDVLKRLHLYLALKENRLYVTPATMPASAPLPAAAGP